MLIVAGTINVDPADVERLRAAAAEMMAATHQEPGCIEYVFSVSVADPGTVQIFEVWESAEDLDDLLSTLKREGGVRQTDSRLVLHHVPVGGPT